MAGGIIKAKILNKAKQGTSTGLKRRQPGMYALEHEKQAQKRAIQAALKKVTAKTNVYIGSLDTATKKKEPTISLKEFKAMKEK